MMAFPDHTSALLQLLAPIDLLTSQKSVRFYLPTHVKSPLMEEKLQQSPYHQLYGRMHNNYYKLQHLVELLASPHS
ncbi:hypothetical protein D3C79_979770 [compost metagenome]